MSIPDNSPETETIEKTTGQSSYELFLLSTTFFVFSALLLQFLLNLPVAYFLHRFSFPFTYSLFHTGFSATNDADWTLLRILLTFTTGPVLAFIGGIILLNLRFRNWKVRLALTWLAFFMIMTLPLTIFSGIIVPKGFGMAWSFLISNQYIRVIAAIAALLIVTSRTYWIRRFLRTASSFSHLENELTRKRYIFTVFIRPWFVGFPIICLFALSGPDWVWAIFITGLGGIILPLFSNEIPITPVRIYKTELKHILSSRYHLAIYAGLAIVLYLVSLMKIPF